MDLVKLDKRLPLRAYPDEDLNRVLLMEFTTWISGLLSLTDETSAERLEISLPAVKELCIGMGFDEIKKMFEMYVDGKLSLKPIPNYFDRILLGKIVAEYKSKTKKPKVMQEKILTDEEQEFIMIEAVDRLTKEYKENKEISGAFTHVYEYLFKKGVLPKHTKEFKSEIYAKAQKIAKAEAMTDAGADYNLHRQLKDTIKSIETGTSERITPIAKKLILEIYFNDNI